MKKYHYTECGLDNVYLINGFDEMEFDGETVYAVHDTDGLHQVIGEGIINKTRLLSGQEIRFLRKEIGLSQKDLGKVLGKTDQTVANWEKNKGYVQSQAEDIIIRMTYAEKMGVSKSLTAYLNQLALDEIDRLERDFTEQEGKWGPTPLAA